MSKKEDGMNGKHKISRRDFVKTSSSLAAGGLLLGSLPVGAGAYAGGTATLKIALVGCGGRGTGAARQALSTGDGVQLVAMADAFRDRLDESFETLNKVFDDEPEKLNVPEEHKFVGFDAYKNAIELADVVILATPPGFRPDHFEAAIQADKHVFMEKPLATDAPGVRKIMEAGKMADQKGLNVVVGLQRHYQNSYREVINRINDGAVGDIVSGQVYWNSDGVWVRERQPHQNEMEFQMRNWYYFTWLCGDHIMEQHIHNIDVANWFIGEYPESAQGMGGREVRTGSNHGQIFDHHFVEFTYPSGAVIASQCRHQPNTMSRVAEFFQGTKGTIDTSGDRGILKSWDGETLYDHNADTDPNPYQQEHDELFAAIRNGDHINDTEYGAKSTLTALMGRMATYSGEVINWEDALNSPKSLMPEKYGWEETPPVVPNEDGKYPVPVPGKTEVIA
ncbi:Gfo/Idh/MocA family oxidoreductase [Aliifodinibius sp. S!AR15-10]|uniref:Gfo/Idh/MocA family protein n=1 Tax=Aliifodinibius sp. S!AR15-10 TaxID=2950437 RepID=UPI002857E016|nr:Gfo/Idh/MocA family oxidoreductase [Aliifodinibius sp. S!AR15-10]MDR8392540.1 Gfo/Idh/MocA family oxidoreductase [Aliifodinibius sp. S!AR15-10]